jgi:hypothetical protein
MQTQILFKAQRVDGKGWVKGTPYYIEKEGVCFIIKNCQSLNLTSEYSLFLGIEVIPETVSQFTGLTDKNGTRIFENDTCLDENDDLCFIIRMKCGTYALQDMEIDYVIDSVSFEEIEVIGNVHDKNEKL